MNVMVKNSVEVRDAFRQEDYSFTVDWLNVRLDCDNLDLLLLKISTVFPEIDIFDWEERESGICFYDEALYLPHVGYSSVVIAFNRDIDGRIINAPRSEGGTYGVLVSISGDGCRYINSLHDNGFVDLLKVFVPFSPRCTRVDMACDIFDKDNLIVPMIQTFCDYAYDRDNAPIDFNCNLNRGKYDSDGNFIYRQWVTSNIVYDNSIRSYCRNVTIGGRDCKKGTVQLYNKLVEIKEHRLSEHSEGILNSLGNPDYWWRLEYRCKSFAQRVYDTLVQSGSIYQAFLQAANDMGTFVVPTDNNISRCDTCVEWVAFLDFVLKLANGIHLVQFTELVNIPYIGSELDRVRKFHSEQISSNDAVNLILLMLDSEYREKTFNLMCHQLAFNKKLKPALQEISVKYGYKIEEIVDFAWSLSTIFENIA